MRIRVGMFTAQCPPGSRRKLRELDANILHHARLADELGLDSFWVAEHYFAEYGYMTRWAGPCK